MKRLKHKLFALTLLVTTFSSSVMSQSVEDQYVKLTSEWLEVSDVLSDYYGLSEYCKSSEFREYTINILEQLHHFDSVMIDFLNEPMTEMLVGKKEYNKTLKDITNFEVEYSNKAFLDYLKESCHTRRALEKDKKDLQGYMGANSYDGQILVLENGLAKYLKHINKRILSIDKHMHMIHPERIDLRLASTDAYE